MHDYKPPSHTYHPSCSFSPKIPNNQTSAKKGPAQTAFWKSAWRFHYPCWSYDAALVFEGDSVLCKSTPGQSEVTGSGAYSYVTYLPIWHVCMSKLPWLLKISVLFPLKAHLPVIRMYILIKISKSLEVSQFPLMMNGMSLNARWKTWTTVPVFWTCCWHTILPEGSMDLWMLSFHENQPCVHTEKHH